MIHREDTYRTSNPRERKEVIPKASRETPFPLKPKDEVIPLQTKDFVIISDIPQAPEKHAVFTAPVVNVTQKLSSIPPDAYLGRNILGRYDIQSLIGVGGMGRVYKAYQQTVDRFVAVKILPRELAGANEQIAKRFQLEARAASRLSHPNTITVHDFGQLADGSLCIVMEYLTGQTLEYVIAEHPSVARVLRIALQICGSLAEAHQNGIIHRDLKPPNIIVSAIGEDKDWVKVVDFGIVKMLDTSNSLSLSVAGMVSGTPEYMSPEQVQDEPVDARSDIYSLGLLLYELFTSKPVVHCKTPLACMYAHIHNPPIPFSRVKPNHEVPEGLEEVVFKMLAKNPEDRFQSITELMPVLTEFLLGDVSRRKSQPPAGAGILGSMLPPSQSSGFLRSPSDVAVGPVAELDMLENLASLYESRGEPEQATEVYRKIASVHMEASAYQEAVKFLKDALALSPNDEASRQMIETCFAILDRLRMSTSDEDDPVVIRTRSSVPPLRRTASHLRETPSVRKTPSPVKKAPPVRHPSKPVRELTAQEILAAKLERAVKEKNIPGALSMIRTTLANDPTNETAVEYAGLIYETVGDSVLDQDEIIWLKALLGKAGDKTSQKPSFAASERSEAAQGMVIIEGGTFESVFGGTFRVDTFEMQKHPVTNTEYQAFIKATGELPPSHWLGNEPPKNTSDMPVVGVTIQDARNYAAWCDMVLPTAVEWEAAVRLPDGRAFPWGNEWKDSMCHCKENGAVEPASVGKRPEGASHWGCLDLLGNVWEWTENHEGMKSPEHGYHWVMGGSFRHPCVKNGKIARTDVSENGAYPYLGFRCARRKRASK